MVHLLLSRQIAWRKTGKAAANLAACFLRRPPPYYPPVIQLDITNTCNLKCPGCLTGRRIFRKPPGFMSFHQFTALIDEIRQDTLLAVLYNSGEPMLHPAVLDMVACLTANEIASIISTNGHFLETREKAEYLVQAGLSELIVSLSGATQETYQQYHRGGNLVKVMQAVQLVAAAKKRLKKRTPHITLRLLLTENNLAERQQMIRLARSLGGNHIDIRYANRQIQAMNYQVDTHFAGETFPGESPLSSLKSRNSVCLWPWLLSVVNWNGDVAPCCFYHLNLPDMGNAFEGDGMQDVWYGKAYENFRRKMRAGKNTIPLCRSCPAETGFQSRFNRQGDL